MKAIFNKAFFEIKHSTKPDAIKVGGFRLADIWDIDPLIKIWISHFYRFLKRFWILEPLVRRFVIRDRFITTDEFRALHDSNVLKPLHPNTPNKRNILVDVQKRFPIFEVLNIKDENQRIQLGINYPNERKGYIELLRTKHPRLSQLFLNWHDLRFDKKEFFTHAYAIGGTGSGKSELLKYLVRELINQNDSAVIVIDPNGDMAEQIAQFKENVSPQREDKLIYFDPTMFAGHTQVLNPFDIDKTDNHLVDITTQELTKAFNLIFEEQGGEFTLNMKALVAPTIGTVLRKENGSMWDWLRFMNDELNADLIELGLKSPNESFRHFFEHDFKSVEYRLTKRGILTRIQELLNSPTFKNILVGKSSFNLKQEIEAKKLIVFNLSKGKLGVSSSKALGRIIISMIQSLALQRANRPENQRTPTFLIVDEFQNFVNPTIEEILTESRKYALYLIVAHQTIGQNMSSSFVNLLLSNTNVKFIGINDFKSLKRLSDEIDVPVDEMKVLETGSFYTKIKGKGAVKIQVSKQLLKTKNSMSPEQWKTQQLYMKHKYYWPLGVEQVKSSAPPPAETNKLNPNKSFNSKFEL
jgi:type IV secretory pathway TraG/TraD family ATPase VirD4